MNFIKKGIIFYWLITELNVGVLSTDFTDVVANATNAIAEYFSVDCIYFLKRYTANDTLINQRLVKLIAMKLRKTIAFHDWSQFHEVSESGKEQCLTPLKIILHLNDACVSEDFKNFTKTFGDDSDKVRTGVWLILLRSFEDDFITKFFRDVYLPFEAEILIGWISNAGVQLKEVYQVSPSYPVRIPHFGSWSSKTGLISPLQSSLYARRMNLEGLQLRVGYIDQNLPFVTSENNSLKGYYLDIWRILEETLNISSKFIKVKKNYTKDEDANSWMIIIKMLREKKLDLGIGSFIISSSRADLIDFSHPLLDSRFQVFYRNSPSVVWPQTHFLPFETEVWIAVLIWYLVHIFSILCTCFLLKRGIKDIVDIAFITFGGLCGQSAPNIPKFVTFRLLFLLTYIVAAVVIPSYSASLTRYLAIRPTEVIFRDFKDFYLTGTHKMIVVEGTFEYYFFKLSYNEEYPRKIYERDIKNSELPTSHSDALHWVCRESDIALFSISSTLIWEWNQIENLKLRNKCSLKKMPQNVGRLISGFIYQKKSRFRGIFDNQLTKLHSQGVIQRLKAKYWAKDPQAMKRGRVSISLRESTALFSVLFTGTILSFIIFVFEKIVKNFRSDSRKQKFKKRPYRSFY